MEEKETRSIGILILIEADHKRSDILKQSVCKIVTRGESNFAVDKFNGGKTAATPPHFYTNSTSPILSAR